LIINKIPKFNGLLLSAPVLTLRGPPGKTQPYKIIIVKHVHFENKFNLRKYLDGTMYFRTPFS